MQNGFLDALHEDLGLDRDAGLQVMHWVCADPAVPVSDIAARLAAGETPPRSLETAPGPDRAAVQALAEAARAAVFSGSPYLAGPAAAGALETVLADAVCHVYAVTRDTAVRAASSVIAAGDGPERNVYRAVRLLLAEDPAAAEPARSTAHPPADREAPVLSAHHQVARHPMPPYEILRPGGNGSQKKSCACGDDKCPHAAAGTVRDRAALALYRHGWTPASIDAALPPPPWETRQPAPELPGL